MALLGEKEPTKKDYGKLYNTAEVSVEQGTGRIITTVKAFDDDPENESITKISARCAAKLIHSHVASLEMSAAKEK